MVDGPTWTGNVIGQSISWCGRGHGSGRWLAPRGDLGQHASRLLAADLADVLLVLEHHAERLVDQCRLELPGAERQTR
jgi:hypothetical protein